MTAKKLSLQINPRVEEIAKAFELLVNVMYTLRSEQGCKWDRAQTPADLKQYLLEEAYEVLEALDEEDVTQLKEELGDLLFQVIFLAQIQQEQRNFSLVEILELLTDKMIRRHPHVFGDAEAGSPAEALKNWESIKSQEGGKSGQKTLLEGVPHNLPALLQANLISTKVARVGFDWPDEKEVWKKFEEELDEFKTASSPAEKEEEMGDLLFTLVNVARKNGINPEDALRSANRKFKRRFDQMEENVRQSGKKFEDLSLAELDTFWDGVKNGVSDKK